MTFCKGCALTVWANEPQLSSLRGARRLLFKALVPIPASFAGCAQLATLGRLAPTGRINAFHRLQRGQSQELEPKQRRDRA